MFICSHLNVIEKNWWWTLLKILHFYDQRERVWVMDFIVSNNMKWNFIERILQYHFYAFLSSNGETWQILFCRKISIEIQQLWRNLDFPLITFANESIKGTHEHVFSCTCQIIIMTSRVSTSALLEKIIYIDSAHAYHQYE